MNAYDLSEKARKFIGRWSRDEFYVYIRPTSSKYAEPTKPEGQWWVVAVQVRAMPPHEFREEGRSLDACILALGSRIPRRKDLKTLGPRSVHESYIGFLAPHALWKEKHAGVSGDRTKSALYKKSVATEGEAKKEAMSKKGRLGPMHDRQGDSRPADATAKGHGKVKTKKSKKNGKKK